MSDGFGHEIPYEGHTNDWITPRWIVDAFNSLPGAGWFFDLDPCSSLTQPWPTAKERYTVADDGLHKPWHGVVYCNPPYGPHTKHWVTKLAKHGEGVALIFARLETKLWQEEIFPTASGYLFPARRIAFARPDGTTPKASAGAPSALIAWGNRSREALRWLVHTGAIPGAFMDAPICTRKELFTTQERGTDET
jgi:hypothetical protein